jgi:hypothetical protein
MRSDHLPGQKRQETGEEAGEAERTLRHGMGECTPELSKGQARNRRTRALWSPEMKAGQGPILRSAALQIRSDSRLTAPRPKPSPQRYASPYRLDETEGPRALQEPIDRTQDASSCKTQDEPGVAALVRVADHHRRHRNNSKCREPVHGVESYAKGCPGRGAPGSALAPEGRVFLAGATALTATVVPLTVLAVIAPGRPCRFAAACRGGVPAPSSGRRTPVRGSTRESSR